MDNLRLSVAPCRQSCPLHINCQGVMRLIGKGKEPQTIAMLNEFLPFMDLLGILCHAPCEKACARKKVDKPVHIRALHRYLAEHTSHYIAETFRQIVNEQTGKKVAIWGSGPAAMMAAWRLGRSGHQIVMFEPEKELGGALRDYSSMSDDHAQAIHGLVDAIAANGTDLKKGAETPTVKKLFNSYDAVIITYKDDGELSRILDQNDIDEMSFQVDPRTLQVAGQEKMFVCKDLGSSRSRLVNALAAGKIASESTHRLLLDVPLMWERSFWETKGYVKEYSPVYELAKHVQQEDKESKESEGNTILKINTKEAAIFEAERCLGCGRPFDANQTCWYCLPCEIECPTNAIEVRIPYILR
jgi:NADPH-dependent glutamate synthase beta subunit-like oxidoreductase